MEVAIGKDGRPVVVEIETRSGRIRAKVWRVKVGRRDLLLLDSDVEGNAPEDRELTSRLYGGDLRIRIRQEVLLGVGGLRALRALGISPGVLHLNEGHSAFAVLEAIRMRMEDEGIAFDAAVPRVSREVVFTTHTPVPAGHDRFDGSLVEEHIGPLREAIGLSPESLLGLGRESPEQSRRTVLHDSTCPAAIPARQCGLCAACRSVACDVDRTVSAASRKMMYRSDTSPMAYTFPRGWRRRCFAFTTVTWEQAGSSAAVRPRSGKESRTSTTENSGKLI